MKDRTTTPSKKHKAGKKPAVIGDANCRVLIGSVSSYEEMAGGVIELRMKSGYTETLSFKIEYLSIKAMKILDSYFKVELPEHDPCNICSLKDVTAPTEAGLSRGQTHCNGCFKYDNFRPIDEDKTDE